MSFPRYPAYKDSGVEWLGNVPAHWDVTPFKRMVSLQNGADYKDIECEDGYPVIGSGGPFACATEYMHEGESVLLGRKGTIDKPLYVAGRFWTVDTMYWSKIQPGACGRFAYYSALTIPFGYYSTNTALPSMTKSVLEAHLLATPPELEQKAIAAFLDHESAKIDALVAEQECLIELLEEKRQAVISHAVTKGMDPSVPMKESGVEWLGKAPAHWEIVSLRYVLEAIGDVDHYMPSSVEKGIPYLMTGDLRDRASDVNFEECKQVSDDDFLALTKKIKSSRGDVVLARYATIGTLMYVDVDLDFLVSYSCVTLKTNPSKISGLYLSKFMKSDAFLHSVEKQVNTNTQGNVGIKDLQSIKLVVPPIEEQSNIVRFLEPKVTELEALIAESTQVLSLLRERRTALISAAVTGQIDVRGWVPAEAIA